MSDALLEPAQVLESSPIVGQGPKYKRLSVTEIGLILRLHDEGLTQVQIAQRLDKDQTAISQILSRLAGDSTAIALRLMKARSYQSAQRVTALAEKGKADVALKAARTVLEASGVLSTSSSITLGMQVVLGTPEQAAVDMRHVIVTVVPEPAESA